jgi:arylsulfatase A-like enzyme
MTPLTLNPGNSLVILVSFEGPDPYAQAGGLGVRVTGLAHTLAELGYETHLFFIGDPHLPGEETRGRLTLHRWAQWISAYHPRGVYDGEEDKRGDLASSLPSYPGRSSITPTPSHLHRAAYQTARSYAWDGIAQLRLKQVGRRARDQGLLRR